MDQTVVGKLPREGNFGRDIRLSNSSLSSSGVGRKHLNLRMSPATPHYTCTASAIEFCVTERRGFLRRLCKASKGEARQTEKECTDNPIVRNRPLPGTVLQVIHSISARFGNFELFQACCPRTIRM